MEQAMSGAYPTLATVRKYQEEQTALDAIVEIISFAAALVNTERNLTPMQVEYIAAEIMEQYFYLTLGDIRFLMKQGIAGKYGEIYGRLDVPVVMGWVEKYADDRANHAETRSAQVHKSNTATANAIPMPEWFKKFIDEHTIKTIPALPFEPDDNFWKMVEQEHAESGSEMPIDQFKKMRLAQTKAMFQK